jgi:hypothetical protein
LHTSKISKSELLDKLNTYISRIENKHLKKLITNIFEDAELKERFVTSPAAVTYHHAFIGGLIEHVVEIIKNTFNAGTDYTSQKFSQDDKFAHLRLYDALDPLFKDIKVRLQRHGSANESPEILDYLAMPEASKKNDFYLYEPSGDYYWDSEYYYKNKPAPFRTSFIIHLDTVENNQTKIQIFELMPEIHVGEYIGFSGHSMPFPGKFWDIRWVEPTISDKIDILNIIKGNLKNLEQTTNISTSKSPFLSSDKKSIRTNGKVLLAIDDDVIFNFFKAKSQLCDEYNITTTAGRKIFCENKTIFKNATSFKSIVVSPDGKKVGFAIESNALSPDTVVGIFYPNSITNKVNFLSDYYLGNEFISFSPNGKNFVYSGGCWEAICAFYIKDAETLKDKINFIPPEVDKRGNYEFVRWISDDEIEYKLDKELKMAKLFSEDITLTGIIQAVNNQQPIDGNLKVEINNTWIVIGGGEIAKSNQGRIIDFDLNNMQANVGKKAEVFAKKSDYDRSLTILGDSKYYIKIIKN